MMEVKNEKKRKGKSIQITHSYMPEKQYLNNNFNELKPMLWRREKSTVTNMNSINQKGITSVVLTNHAWERWNERVSTSLVTIFQLHSYLKSCIVHLGRMRFLNPNFAMIDEDIVLHYEIKEKQIVIITFYGRISNKPGLSDVNLLLEFLSKKEDRISLVVTVDQLTNNLLLPIPSHHMMYKGRLTTYELNIFITAEGHICELINFKDNVSKIWNLADPNVTLSKSTITALKYLRLRK